MHSFSLSQEYPGIHDFRMELTALSYITKINQLTFLVFFSLPKCYLLVTGRHTSCLRSPLGGWRPVRAPHAVTATDQMSTENKDLFYWHYCCQHREEKRMNKGPYLPPLSRFNIRARMSFTEGCQAEKHNWTNPSVLGSRSKSL